MCVKKNKLEEENKIVINDDDSCEYKCPCDSLQPIPRTLLLSRQPEVETSDEILKDATVQWPSKMLIWCEFAKVFDGDQHLSLIPYSVDEIISVENSNFNKQIYMIW